MDGSLKLYRRQETCLQGGFLLGGFSIDEILDILSSRKDIVIKCKFITMQMDGKLCCMIAASVVDN